MVGRLIRARGNRGELVGEIYSSHPGRAEKLKQVVLESEGRQRPSEVESVWNHDGRPIFKPESISDADLNARLADSKSMNFCEPVSRAMLSACW